ncbi:SGNH hydrolase-type esterase domain-containing protein [Aspergillus spectabilis]
MQIRRVVYWLSVGQAALALQTGPGSLLPRDPFDDSKCRRYDQAYGPQVSRSNEIQGPKPLDFSFIACSGAKTKHVRSTAQDTSSGGGGKSKTPQADQLQDINPDWVTLSIGGNDVKFVDVLDRCVYRFYDIKGCAGCTPSVTFDDCSSDCEKAMNEFNDRLNSREFQDNLRKSYQSIFDHAPNTQLFVTGYPAFWNAATDKYDKVSFKTGCINNSVLPLIKERRQRMNELTYRLNNRISLAVHSFAPPGRGKITYVEVNRYFEGHRFCEEGVDEPSYRNPNIWFYPFEYSTGPTALIIDEETVLSEGEDCDAIDDGGDDGDYYACLLSNATRSEEGTSVNLSQWPNNVPGDDELGIASSGNLPLFLARIFHPTSAGFTGYKEAVLTAYREASIVSVPNPLLPTRAEPGIAVKPGTKLRILCVGDSITVGFLSDRNGGDGDGYRRRLRDNLSEDEVVFAGTESTGTMTDGYFAAWSGKTIQYIADHIGPSLEQRPNIILVHAGTNDMNPNPDISTEGNDPAGAVSRLGTLVDQMIEACPDAVILVAQIINTCDENQSARTKEYQKLIPGMVESRLEQGHHVIAVDFTGYPTSSLRDCIHPTNQGYSDFGDYWYDFVTQIPQTWIQEPEGDDPDRPDEGSGDNGGIDNDIPDPDWGTDPVQASSKLAVRSAYNEAREGGTASCNANPAWRATGKIALGLGNNGNWQYEKNWVETGKVADGIGRDPAYVRLHDMNGDGKADYVWLRPENGEIRCWINNLPEPWSPAGTNGDIIGSGAGREESVFLADMNGDGLDDYMVVNPDNGAVNIWWNYGYDESWVNGWKFVEGGQIASGVRHANWETLRFPDINGDGRGDYVYIGKGGSLHHWMNTGSPGGEDVLFLDQGGIATGASPDIERLVFADMDGDGRNDYLIWDDQAGLTGFLNKRTHNEGVPLYINQGPAKTIADGITQKPGSIRLADMDGDGKDDYAYIDQDGAIWLWYNRGAADTSMAIDGIRFADIDGDGNDDYIWLDPETGAPTVYVNDGPDDSDVLGWAWRPLNGGQPVASGAAPASMVQFGDVNGDGLDDYLVLDPETGELTAYLNEGADEDFVNNWRWNPIGSIATGLGPGANVRFADIDGDGFDEYIFLKDNGGTVIYRNVFNDDTPDTQWRAMPEADASGIGQRPEEISFHDINGDGKADYVWTRASDGAAWYWQNNYPNTPTWLEQGRIAGGVGTSGMNVRYAQLQDTGRASYVAINPDDGAIAAWLNRCNDLGPEPIKRPNGILIDLFELYTGAGWSRQWYVYELKRGETVDVCDTSSVYSERAQTTANSPDYPVSFEHEFTVHGIDGCTYKGSADEVGRLICPDMHQIACERSEEYDETFSCGNGASMTAVLECWW